MNEKSTRATRTIGVVAAAAVTVAMAGGCDTGAGESGFSKPGSSIGSKFKPKSGFGTSSKTKRR